MLSATAAVLALLCATVPTGGQAAVAATAPARTAGILYELWHTKAAQMMQRVVATGAPVLTTERVIRSDGKYTLDDVYRPVAPNVSDIYNVEPQLGFYCLYRPRQGEQPLADTCANISGTARAHADMLVGAGFDYVAADLTNWPGFSTVTDVAVTRPLEVLADEWATLRRAGVSTPRIAAWPSANCGAATCSGNTSTWQWVLNHVYSECSRAQSRARVSVSASVSAGKVQR